MTIGSGTPINHSSTPRPKPMIASIIARMALRNHIEHKHAEQESR
jgi:hypothetical protein